jgi:uncharacterized protein YdhG (YjbR/CyaY superfamily)
MQCGATKWAWPQSVGEVGAYLRTVEGRIGTRSSVCAIACEVVPEAEEGTSYAMPALLYRDKGLIATVRAKKFLSLYPYSGGSSRSFSKR